MYPIFSLGKRGAAKAKKGKAKKNQKDKPVVTADTIADDARRLLVPVPEAPDVPHVGPSEGPDSTGDVDLTPVVGSAVRRFYDAGQLAVKSKVSTVRYSTVQYLSDLLTLFC